MLIFKKSNYKIENGIEVNRTPKGFNAQQLAIVLTYQCKLFQTYVYLFSLIYSTYFVFL